MCSLPACKSLTIPYMLGVTRVTAHDFAKTNAHFPKEITQKPTKMGGKAGRRETHV